MERLTIRNSDGSVSQPTGLNWAEALNRLAAYEDTGLTPEDCAEYRKFEDEIIASGKTFGRLVELLKGDKDGRLIMLPCKVGDTVWAASGKIIKCEIDETYLCGSGGG